jgi:hypothetical protein
VGYCCVVADIAQCTSKLNTLEASLAFLAAESKAQTDEIDDLLETYEQAVSVLFGSNNMIRFLFTCIPLDWCLIIHTDECYL